MKVIFLDVDGVFNNGNWAIQMHDVEGVDVFYENLLYDKALRCLKLIVDTTGARIVVSSTWRLSKKQMYFLSSQLADYGMNVFGVTPRKNGERGDEIDAWLKSNDVESYVILDDDSDMGAHMDHLIQTSFRSGLLPEHAERAIRMLNGDDGDD